MSKLTRLPDLLIVICVANAIGCQPSLTRGSSSSQKEHGIFFTLDYVDSRHHVGVAFVFPGTIDALASLDGTGENHLSMTDGRWNVDRVVRFKDDEKGIDINFSYCAANSRFWFRGETHALNLNELVVIRFDEQENYNVEIMTMNDNTRNKLLREMGMSESEQISNATEGGGTG